jgi:uncharacterized protein YgiM (DUF1202 family)
MKQLLCILALLVQTLIVSAFTPNPDSKAALSRASTENVKMYRQAGTSTEILRALKSTDDVLVIRKHNTTWSIVSVNGQVGYVLTSEIYQPKEVKNILRTRSDRLR